MGWLDFDYDFRVKNGCSHELRVWRKTSLHRIRRQDRWYGEQPHKHREFRRSHQNCSTACGPSPDAVDMSAAGADRTKGLGDSVIDCQRVKHPALVADDAGVHHLNQGVA